MSAVLVAMLGLPGLASADVFDGGTGDASLVATGPSISSDKDDYAPGETVTLVGSNWQPGESVRIVVNDDGLNVEQPWQRDVTVTSDADGYISDSFQLPSWFVAAYTVTATGELSGAATASFTDAISTNTVLTSSLNPSNLGQSVTFTATVTCSLSCTFDTNHQVQFKDGANANNCNGGTVLGTVTGANLTGTGLSRQATFTTSALTAGTHPTMACFSGGGANPRAGASNSAPLSQVVNACTAASVATQPSNQSITYGADATFTAAGAGNPASTVQWQVSTDNGSTWSNVSGATGTTLTLTKPGVALSGHKYRAVFTNTCGGTETATSNAATLTVSKKTVTGSFTAAGKVYDGTSGAAITGRSLQGAISGDDVSLSGGTASFDDKNAGTDKPVSGSGFTLAGAAAGNYEISTVPSTTADIDARPVTASITAADKTYDGTTAATITGCTLNTAANGAGVLAGEAVGCSATNGEFANKNAGQDKPLSADVALSGTDKVNYALTSATAATTADIDRADLTISTVADSKVYDGTTSSSGVPTVSGLKTGDTVTNRTQAFQSKDVMGTNGSTLAVTAYTINDGNSGGNYSVSTETASGTITKAALTVQPSPKTPSRQYSDPNPSFSPSYTGFVDGETPAVLGTGPTCSTVATIDSGPGGYAITCSGGVDNNYSFNYQPGTLTVTKEDASAEFSGSTYYSTPTAGGSVTVTLSAVVTDAADGSRGDIRKATVSFVNRDASGQPAFTNCANRPVGLVTTGDTTVGTATCTTTLTAGTSQTLANLYTVGIVVNNWYTRDTSQDNVVVTVAQSVAGSITGGGFLGNEQSGGQYAGDAGRKTNFGFNVRLDKSGVKGQMNTIVRRGGRVYQIKGNAMTSLSTKACATGAASATCPGTSVFNGKANIQDITNPLAPISIDGNASLQVAMTDRGEPGSNNDAIGVTLWDKNGGLWFSSRWVSPNTVEQALSGGNLAVR